MIAMTAGALGIYALIGLCIAALLVVVIDDRQDPPEPP